MNQKQPPLRPLNKDRPPPLWDDQKTRQKKEKLHIRLRNHYRADPLGALMTYVVILLLSLFILIECRYLIQPAMGRGFHRTIFALQAPYFFRYDLHPPQLPEPNKLYPLVVVMRDMKEPAYAARTLVRDRPKFFPSFVLVPRIPYHTAWATPEDPRFAADNTLFPDAAPVIVTMIAFAVRDYPIDPKRIYLVGDKDGAAGVYGLLEKHPETFAAGLITAGSWSPYNIQPGTAKLRIYHGAADTQTPPRLATTLAGVIKSQGGQAELQIIDNADHNLGPAIYKQDEPWAWLFKQSLP